MPLPNITAAPRLRAHTPDRPDHLEKGGGVSGDPNSHSLQFGIYRDGDNNLDEAQAPVIDQAQDVSERDPQVAFHIEDTTERDDGIEPDGFLRTETYDLENGEVRDIHAGAPQDMANPRTLAQFTEDTLDRAERNHATATWLDLVDHGGGNGGAFQTNMSGGGVMREDDIAKAIAAGIHAHAQAHPEDAGRKVDGVVMNACLMATLGLESALSHDGVRYLAASPETMIAPGAPSAVAYDIAAHLDDPAAMAKAVVQRVMQTRYGIAGERYGPAAAFDVVDLNPQNVATMEKSVTALNHAIVNAAADPMLKAAMKSDGRDVEGMTRSQNPGLPWHADRPAEELYDALANDDRLPGALRQAATQAHDAVANMVLAHRESGHFAPFGDESYRDAAGPTVHFPVTKKQIDPWAPVVSETQNAFARKTGEAAMERALT